jgi:biotin carboxylase
MTARCVIFYNFRFHPLEYLPAFYAARRLGLDVLLVTDQQHLDPLADLVREVTVTDTYDVESAVQAGADLAKRYPVDGVLTWSDRDVITVAMLADRLGLPAPGIEAARNARLKLRMREALREHPELIPRYARVTEWADAERAAQDIGYPAVLKPAAAAGSVGIFELRTPDQLRPAFDSLTRLLQPSVHPMFGLSPGEMILEEFLTGSEHSVEGYVHSGTVDVVGITDKTTLPPHHLELRHVFPSGLTGPVQARVGEFTRTVVAALGLDGCVFHIECKVDGEHVRLVEAAARIGGGYITSHLVPLATGESFYGNAIRIACGSPPVTTPRLDGVYAGLAKLVPDRDGTFGGVPGLADALRLPGVEHVALERDEGSEVVLPPRSYAKGVVGAVIGTAATHEGVDRLLDGAVSALTPVIR